MCRKTPCPLSFSYTRGRRVLLPPVQRIHSSGRRSGTFPDAPGAKRGVYQPSYSTSPALRNHSKREIYRVLSDQHFAFLTILASRLLSVSNRHISACATTESCISGSRGVLE